MDFTALNSDADLLLEKLKAQTIDAPAEFEKYLETVKNITSFSNSNVWNQGWREKIYNLGRLFSNPSNINPGSYLLILSKLNSDGKNEPLSFVYSEIIWNFYINKQGFVEDEFKKMTTTFPGNPEFFHSYGHYLIQQENFIQAFNNYKQAINLENNEIFVSTLFNSWASYFSRLIRENKIDEAKTVLSDIQSFFQKEGMTRYLAFKNIAFSMSDRLEDMVTVGEKVKDMSLLIDRRVEKVEANIIAVVTFVTALIAYLIIGANVVINAHNIKDSFFLLYGLGIVILIFSISLSCLFSFKNDQQPFWSFLKDRKFWAIISLIAILLFSYHTL